MCPKPWSALRVLAATLIVSFSNVSPASAISLTNRDGRDHRVSVLESGGKSDHQLKPGDALASICQKGCIVRLNDSENDEYELEGDEIVSIEDGYLYYDGPIAPQGEGGNSPGSPVPPPMPTTPQQ